MSRPAKLGLRPAPGAAFRALVLEEMARQRLTRTALAARLGCAPSNVTRLLRGNLTAATMARLAVALEVEVAIDLVRRVPLVLLCPCCGARGSYQPFEHDVVELWRKGGAASCRSCRRAFDVLPGGKTECSHDSCDCRRRRTS